MARYALVTKYGVLEIYRDADWTRYVSIASIAQMLGLKQPSKLTSKWAQPARNLVDRSGVEPMVQVSNLTRAAKFLSYSDCGGVGVGIVNALRWLQTTAADEIEDIGDKVFDRTGDPVKHEVIRVEPVESAAHAVIDIPIHPFRIGRQGEVNAIDATKLHAALKSTTEFDQWVETALEGFNEHVHYEIVRHGLGAPDTYMIGFDLANDIAQRENTPEGREVRTYFQNWEKRGQQLLLGGGLNETVVEGLRDMLNTKFQEFRVEWDDMRAHQKTIDARLANIEAQTNRGFVPLLRAGSGSVSVREAAKRLGMAGRRDAGFPSLNGLMIEIGWVEPTGRPTPTAVQSGYLRRNAATSRVTDEGLARLVELTKR